MIEKDKELVVLDYIGTLIKDNGYSVGQSLYATLKEINPNEKLGWLYEIDSKKLLEAIKTAKSKEDE